MADEKKVINVDLSQVAKPEKGDNGYTDSGSGSGLSLANPNQEARGEIQVGTYNEAGLRPVGSSSLQIYGTIANNRPVSISPLRVVSFVGKRPIFASQITVLNEFGGRPIVVSNPALMEVSNLPGGRPIASNETDEGEGLMGYLD